MLSSVQVAWEVGQECLKALGQFKGGLLGENHSWVAGVHEQGLPRTEQQSVADGGTTVKERMTAMRRLVERLKDWAYNTVENAADDLSVNVHLQAPRSSLLIGAAAIAIVAHIAQKWTSP